MSKKDDDQTKINFGRKVFRMQILFFFSVLFLILTVCGCSRKSTNDDINKQNNLIVVGFSQVGSESEWRNANTASMQQAFTVENGYRLIFDDAQQKQEKQITAIRNFINQGVDYIVLAPRVEEGWDTVLGEAKAAGIPVIIVDRMIEVSDPDLFSSWVGSDFRKEGDTAVAWLAKNLKDMPRIVHLQGHMGSSAQIGRTEGLENGLKENPDWQLVYQAPGDFVKAKGEEVMEACLMEGIDFNVIYSENDDMAFGAVDALKSHGIQPGKDVIIIAFDASSTALNMVLSGEISLDVECNPLHGPRVRAIIEQLERGETPEKYTYVEETSFDISNLTDEIITRRGY